MLKQHCRNNRSGYTLIELAVVLMIVGLFVGFGVMSFTGTSETRDATMVQSAQATLQAVISQGAVRMDVAPTALLDPPGADNVVNAMEALLQEQGGGANFQRTGSGVFSMTVAGTGRTATYTVQNSGDVWLTNLGGGWSHYSVDGTNHVIRKN